MNDLPTQQELLDTFLVEARSFYGTEKLEPSVVGLCSRLLSRIPINAFEGTEPHNRVLLIGDIDDEVAEEFITDDLWPFHYYNPIDKVLEIHLTSPGGVVDSGLAIISAIHAIRRAGRKVHIHVTGEACSMAFWILQSADHRSMEPFGALMVHEEQGGVDGSTTTRLNDAKFSQQREKLLFEALAQRTGRTVKYYQEKSKAKDWFISAAVALEEGLIDEVAVVPPLPASPATAARPKPRTSKAKSTEETPT